MNDPRTDEPGAADAPPPGDIYADERDARAEPAPAPDSREPPRASQGRSFGVVLGLFALLVAFAAAGGVAFTWWEIAGQREVAARHQADAAAKLADIRELVAVTQARVEAQEQRVAAQEERVAAQQQRLGEVDSETGEQRSQLHGLDEEMRQARARLEAFLQEADAGRREDQEPAERAPALAEIEFLLLLARRELALADNPRVALAALREADQRVARLEEPGLGRVRAAINDEIAAVEAANQVDLEGLALRLASLARQVEGLPLRSGLDPRPGQPGAVDQPGEEQAGWDRFVNRMRGATSDLFRVRRSDTPATPLLAPEEAFFLYRNVELDLKSARLAVLGRDPDNYAASLEAARSALQTHFNTRDEAVAALIDAIRDLEGREVAPRWPELHRSLDLLRAAGAR